MKKCGWVYILANKKDGVLYVGVTSDLQKRILEHKQRRYKKSFSSAYNTDKLVYYKKFDTIIEAIREEKRLKGGSRDQKIKLIESINPEWNDIVNFD